MSRVSYDADAIRMLAAILTETGLTEIEITEKDSRIRIVRSAAPAATSFVAGAGGQVGVEAGASRTGAAPGMAAADLSAHPGAVVSPMVGVAYLAPEPGSPDYVAVGQSVTAGQTLLLIEAMKTFNQIKAPKSGVVTRILVASGAPVEYGEALMILE